MKNKPKYNPLLRSFLCIAAFVLLLIAAAMGLFYYLFSIPEPYGLSMASWPNTFTDNFSHWIHCEEGKIHVTESGVSRLDAYGLWIQVLDESGQEVFAYRKPDSYPAAYPVSQLIEMKTKAYEDGHTVFMSSFEEDGETFNYIMGFPYAIGKYMLYYNGAHIGRLSPVAGTVLLFAAGALVLFALGYGFWLSRRLGVITKGIKGVSHRTYKPMKETGTFREIYTALNQMEQKIRHSDQQKQDTDRARQEWIANITHDLKTPLSPIKGYAELLADSRLPDSQSQQEYGSTILKNANHIEKLINDLKLTYQLDSAAVPYTPQKVQMTRYLKELVIDVMNNPAFSGRNITFESALAEQTVLLDPDLLRRAIQNIIINALTHNPPDTKVEITVTAQQENRVRIIVRDNGTGMCQTEQAGLFDRYYRGTNTKEHPQGSGLGLAIAKQVITLHGGDITVNSRPQQGTEFIISLPL